MKDPRLIIPEATYPVTFRHNDTAALASFIQHHESVCLVAMKKVGISPFVRFFFHHPRIRKLYFDGKRDQFLFVFADLNHLCDLTELEFLRFTAQRLVEALDSAPIPVAVWKEVQALWEQMKPSDSLQLVFDLLKKIIAVLCLGTPFTIVLLLLRFDRLKGLFHPRFFTTLQSLTDVAKHRLLYVTTSVRPLNEFYQPDDSDSDVIIFPQTYYVKPLSQKDIDSIKKQLHLAETNSALLTPFIIKQILHLGGGHIMLTRLVLMAWSEAKHNGNGTSLGFDELLTNERIHMACEEIWDNLTKEETSYLLQVIAGAQVPVSSQKGMWYLINTGIISKSQKTWVSFSPLFSCWVQQRKKLLWEQERSNELTKKEEVLLTVLRKNLGVVCDRESIIEAVWPEYEQVDLTVSDWAVDRLVSRLRNKLKHRNDRYQVITIRDKGFKLVQL